MKLFPRGFKIKFCVHFAFSSCKLLYNEIVSNVDIFVPYCVKYHLLRYHLSLSWSKWGGRSTWTQTRRFSREVTPRILINIQLARLIYNWLEHRTTCESKSRLYHLYKTIYRNHSLFCLIIHILHVRWTGSFEEIAAWEKNIRRLNTISISLQTDKWEKK